MNEAGWTLKIWRHIDFGPSQELFTGLERRLWDNTRVDILTTDWAIEVDWAYKWTEAVGQSMWYSLVTHKEPGICLLCKNFKDDKNFIYRCSVVCTKYNIMLWLVDTEKSIGIDQFGQRINL